MFSFIILAVFVVLGLFLWGTYNGLVTSGTRVKEAWSQIDVQLKRKFDLIPNLVETVKGYAAHEKEVFQKVTEARAAAMGATGVASQAEANNMLSNTLKSLFAVAENYPQLKASENFMKLQEELSDTENKIAYARQFYNSNVMDFNVKIKIFPNVLFVGMLGFKEAEFFGVPEETRNQELKVKF
jgi:LemA protein